MKIAYSKFAHSHQINQYSSSGQLTLQSTQVISEQPVSLTVNGEEWITLMCTPIQLEELGIGFLFNERVINEIADIEHIRICPTEDNIDIWLHYSVDKPTSWIRTSGCSGGQTSISTKPGDSNEALYDIDEAENTLPQDDFHLSPAQIVRLTSGLFESQEVYKQTGGVHTSALSDGELILTASEDVGRHNTLDKIAGYCLLKKIKPAHRVLLTTGRISSEMLEKTTRLRASILISRTAPTSLSVQLAEARNITLIGYARRNQFNVYTHPERIRLPEKEKID